MQQLTASVDQVLATANGVVATSGLDARRFVAVLGPDVRVEPDARRHGARRPDTEGPSVVQRASATRICSRSPATRAGADRVVDARRARVTRSHAYEVGFAASGRARPGARSTSRSPCRAGSAAAVRLVTSGSRPHRARRRRVGTAGLTRWGQPVSFAASSSTLLVRAGARPAAVFGISLPVLVLLVGLLLTVIAIAVGGHDRAARRRRCGTSSREPGARRRARAAAAVEAELRASAGTVPDDPPRHARRHLPLRPGRRAPARCSTAPTSSGTRSTRSRRPAASPSLVDPDDRAAADALWARVAGARRRAGERDDAAAARRGRASCATPGCASRRSARSSPRRTPRMLGRAQRRHRRVDRTRSQQAELQEALRAGATPRSGRPARGRCRARLQQPARRRSWRRPSCSCDDVPEGRPQEYASEIERAATRGAALVRQLLTFAQRDRRRGPQLVDLNEIVTGHGAAAAPDARGPRPAPDHHDRLLGRGRRRPDARRAGHPQPRGERARRDARTAACSGSRPRSTSTTRRPENDRVVLSVTDTGDGHPARGPRPDVRAVRHDEGAGQGHRTRTRDRAVDRQPRCKGDQRAHEGRGRHDVRDVDGAPVRRRRRGRGEEPTPRSSTARGRHILLVEDDTAVRFALAHLLRRLDFTVTTSTNGSEALQFARAAALRPRAHRRRHARPVGARADPQPPAPAARAAGDHDVGVHVRDPAEGRRRGSVPSSCASRSRTPS